MWWFTSLRRVTHEALLNAGSQCWQQMDSLVLTAATTPSQSFLTTNWRGPGRASRFGRWQLRCFMVQPTDRAVKLLKGRLQPTSSGRPPRHDRTIEHPQPVQQPGIGTAHLSRQCAHPTATGDLGRRERSSDDGQLQGGQEAQVAGRAVVQRGRREHASGQPAFQDSQEDGIAGSASRRDDQVATRLPGDLGEGSAPRCTGAGLTHPRAAAPCG